MPEPPVSLVVEVSVTGPPTGLPGLSIVALGAVLSMRRLATTASAASSFPAGRRWNATELTSEPPVSLALALNVIVWRRLAPGSVRLEVGAPVSDFASFAEVATAMLPTMSATLYRYLAHLPDARVSGLVAAVQLP